MVPFPKTRGPSQRAQPPSPLQPLATEKVSCLQSSLYPGAQCQPLSDAGTQARPAPHPTLPYFLIRLLLRLSLQPSSFHELVYAPEMPYWYCGAAAHDVRSRENLLERQRCDPQEDLPLQGQSQGSGTTAGWHDGVRHRVVQISPGMLQRTLWVAQVQFVLFPPPSKEIAMPRTSNYPQPSPLSVASLRTH